MHMILKRIVSGFIEVKIVVIYVEEKQEEIITTDQCGYLKETLLGKCKKMD